MCGICGFDKPDKKLIKRMADLMRHRGPDDSGTFVDSSVSLGHRRLSIIDLSEHGKQPMCNEDGTIWLVFNGEVYNFKELRKTLKSHKFSSNTDSEVLIHLYEDFGLRMPEMLEGMFAYCIYDSDKKKLFLARDNFGIKPLYYYYDGANFAFASEMRPILAFGIKLEINPFAFNQFISMRYVYSRESIFKNVFRVLPGHMVTIDLKNRKLEDREYWRLPGLSPSTPNASPSGLLEKINKSVESMLVADVPIGVFLSGGIDSSAIVALMRGASKDSEIKTYSIGFEYGEGVNETPYAKEVSELFGTRHTEFVLPADSFKELPKLCGYLSEPMADPALLPLFYLSRFASKHVKVVLTGDGADELFGGYDQYRILSTQEKLRNFRFLLNNGLARTAMSKIPYSVLDRIYRYSSDLGEMGRRRAIDIITSKNMQEAYFNVFNAFSSEERKLLLGKNYADVAEQFEMRTMEDVLKFDFSKLLPEGYLMKTDSMTMANSLEARVPYLGRELAGYVLGLPLGLKLRGGTTKYLFKKSMEGTLANGIVYRKKQSFHLPIDKWIGNELMPQVEEYLSPSEIKAHGLFDYEHIKKIKENFSSSRLYYARQLWNLLTFQMWYNSFRD